MGYYMLTAGPEKAKSWFLQIRDLCQQYNLPHPLILLKNPPTKYQLKKLVKLRVTDYWRQKLTDEVCGLSSLSYLTPSRCSLNSSHSIWKYAGSSPYEITKCMTVIRMITGKYPTEHTTRHWSVNKEGFCSAPSCIMVEGTLSHLLIDCPSLHSTRVNLFSMWKKQSSNNPFMLSLINTVLLSPKDEIVKFILDPGTNPSVICLLQQKDHHVLIKHIYYLARTYAFEMHKAKQKLNQQLSLELF